MSELSIRIADQKSGSYVATRPANMLDEGGHARVVQLVDFIERQVVHSNLRGGVSPVAVADGVDFSSLPGDLTSNLLQVGDMTSLVVDVFHKVVDGGVIITPIIYSFVDPDYVPVAVRASKGSAMGDFGFTLGSGSVPYLSPQLHWDVMGAEFIGLHITDISGVGNEIVLKGGLL